MINTQQFQNDLISQETNAMIQSVKEYLQNCSLKSNLGENETGFLNIIYYISKFMKKKAINFNEFRSIGLVLFNDRILINHSIFSIFLNWEDKVLYKIISSPIFFCQSLTRSQFIILVNAKYVEGSLFDWRILRYPDCEVTQKIIDNIIPIKGESFFLVSNQVQKMITIEKSNFKLKKYEIVDMPPSRNEWSDDQSMQLEDIFLRYVDETFSPGKCWLLYKNEKAE